MDVALFILHCHPLIVAELRQHNADEQRVALCARNKHRAAAVSAERSKIRQISVIRLDGQERMAGDDALPGHGEAGIVGLETLGIREYKKRAANAQPRRGQTGLVGDSRQGQGRDGNRRWLGEP